MKLHFATRDIGTMNDYPSIGWLPPLPDSAPRPDIEYGVLSMPEYPQIAVCGNGGQWHILVNALSSGRTDSITGEGGRTIRMSLLISGNADEGHKAAAITDAFISETLLKGNEALFEDVFSAILKPGDVIRIKKEGNVPQEEAASLILEKILEKCASSEDKDQKNAGNEQQSDENSEKIQEETPKFLNYPWAGGISTENAMEFANSCRAILDGRLDGTAIALSNLSINEIEYAEELTRTSPLVAALSVLPKDKGAKIRKISPRASKSDDVSSGTESSEGESDNNGISKGMAGAVIGGTALLLSLVAKRGGILLSGAIIGGLAAVYIASRQAQKKNKNKKD